MSEKNVLMKMTIEKNSKINEMIVSFLGHKPVEAEKKKFKIMTQLDESLIYYKGELVGVVKHKGDDGLVI